MKSDCGVKQYSDTELMNISLTKRFFEEVFNQHRRETIYELISPECINHYEHQDLKGPEEWEKKFLDMFLGAIPDVHTEINEIAADGDTVIVKWAARGTFTNEFLGVKPTGKNLEYGGITWIKIENGQSVESWNNWNMSFLLKEIMSELKALRGILPVCSFCKCIRNDKGYWEQVDTYLHKYSYIDVSHGLCLDCMKREYPEFYAKQEMRKKKEKGAE